MDEETPIAIPMKQVRRYFVCKPGYKTVMKWCNKGAWNRHTRKRCVLESFMEGARKFVTIQAIQKFKEETNAKGEDF